jgi:hypothetical protein
MCVELGWTAQHFREPTTISDLIGWDGVTNACGAFRRALGQDQALLRRFDRTSL